MDKTKLDPEEGIIREIGSIRNADAMPMQRWMENSVWQCLTFGCSTARMNCTMSTGEKESPKLCGR
jgi:hypothetical protein